MLTHKGTQEIRTERLLLRRFRIDDYKAMFVWASNPEVTKYLSYFPHKNPDETKELLKIWVSKYDCDTAYRWAIEYNGILIGNIDVVEQSETECHLGWQIDSPYWNKGIMTEAAKAVLDYLFNIGFEKITSAHDTRNIGSGRVMQKIGMTKYDTIENYLLDRVDRIITKECYAIAKTDCLKLKGEKE
ncbi:MAG: GNAT family N-acetyltransferase [Ruminococcus sp.]|nr:GNAT family N-acetyltransferase [Ruminococcus sp.]